MPISAEETAYELLNTKDVWELQERIYSLPFATLAQTLEKMWDLLEEVIVKYGRFTDKVPESELERQFTENEGKMWIKTYYYLLKTYSEIFRPTIGKMYISVRGRAKLLVTKEYLKFRGADILAGVYIHGEPVLMIPMHVYMVPQPQGLPLHLPRYAKGIITKYFSNRGIVVPERVLGIEVPTPIGTLRYP